MAFCSLFVPEARSPRSGCQCGWILLRHLSLTWREVLSHSVLKGQREKGTETETDLSLSCVCNYKGIKLIPHPHDLSQPKYLPKAPSAIIIALGVRTSTYWFWGVSSSCITHICVDWTVVPNFYSSVISSYIRTLAIFQNEWSALNHWVQIWSLYE